MSEAAGTSTSSANAPTITEPNTGWPTARSVTPSPTVTTSPANSLPGVKGTGTDTWYWLATNRTSGKLTAAAATRTTTSPGPGTRDATSSTVTVSGSPYSLQTAART